MSEPDDFARLLERQRRANDAMFSGDPEPYMDLWSKTDPVSLFGAWGPCKTGWDDISRTTAQSAGSSANRATAPKNVA